MMHKAETIAAIRRFNPTAESEFLAEFSDQDLTDYLTRLSETRPAGRSPAAVDLVELDLSGGDRLHDRGSARRDRGAPGRSRMSTPA